MAQSTADGGGSSGTLRAGTVTDAASGVASGATQQPCARYGLVFAIVCTGIVCVNIDTFIVNVAIPSIGRGFGGADLANLSWVLNAYAIVFAALLVPAGRAADLIGRRTAFLVGLVIFGVASAACAVAPGVWALVAARVVQAAGGALLMPASLGLLLAAARPERRAGTIRAWTSVGGAAAALGPVIGGALVAVSWHWVFLVNVPVVIIAVLAGLRVLLPDDPAMAGRAPGKAAAPGGALPDTLGAAVFTVAIGAFALALVKSGDWGWASPATLGLIAAAVIGITAFVRRSATHPSPVIELSLLRMPTFATASAANIVFGTAFGAMLLLVTLWCQDVWGWSALRTGLGVAPGPLLVPLLSIAAGPLARRIGPGPVAAIGSVIYAGGCIFWRLNFALTPDYATRMLPGMLLTGIGVGLTLPTLVSAAISVVPPRRFATGSGVVTMARQVGIVLGVSVLVTILGHPAGAGALAAFQRATVVLAAVAFCAALVGLALIPARRRDQLRRAGSLPRPPVPPAPLALWPPAPGGPWRGGPRCQSYGRGGPQRQRVPRRDRARRVGAAGPARSRGSRMSGDLERSYRRALRLLPGYYRRRWEEDMVAAFLDSSLTGDPEEDELITEYGRPSWLEIASVVGLAARLYLGGTGAPRRYFTWGQAVRNAVLAVTLARATQALGSLAGLAWGHRLFGLAVSPAQLVAQPWGGVWAGTWYAVGYAWVVAYLALVLGYRRTAQAIAGLAVVPDLIYLLHYPGPWAGWILFDLAPVLAMAAFHEDAPPVARRGWLLALPAGFAGVAVPVIAAQASGAATWLDQPGLYCILVTLACLVHVPVARAHRSVGSEQWSLALVLLAVATGVYQAASLTAHPYLLTVGIAELLAMAVAVAANGRPLIAAWRSLDLG